MKDIGKAFTLAEVLITLAIIGVVAALTIPTVVRNYQKQQTVTRLKKTYSALANTTNLAIAEHGPIEGWEIQSLQSLKFAEKYILPYLKTIKVCESGNYQGECEFKFKYLNGENTTISNYYARYYLNDGTFISSGAYVDDPNKQTYAYVYVDVNGQKKPNVLGKDIFAFIYFTRHDSSPAYVGKFVPLGYSSQRAKLTSDVAYACYAGNQVYQGLYCAALIMRDGWQISDDYPW